jgi:magnesium transporter
MESKLFQIDQAAIQSITDDDFQVARKDVETTFLLDFTVPDRRSLQSLTDFGVSDELIACMQEPSEHLRFTTINGAVYGELAFFSEDQSDFISYIGVILQNRTLFLIHPREQQLSIDIEEEISEAIRQGRIQARPDYLLYLLIVEILGYYGKVILKYRAEVEQLSREIDQRVSELEPDHFLASKSRLSDFSQVLEQLFFTLSFPPAQHLLKEKGTYTEYFKELLVMIGLLNQSLEKTEQRLNSLHAHYQLLLQDQSNERINFLTIIQAIFVPVTLLAGIWGMNFDQMPELHFRYGYFMALGSMVVVAIVFLRYFYVHGWFKL